MIDNLENFSTYIHHEIANKEKNLCKFSIYKIEDNNIKYIRTLQKEILINFNNINDIISYTNYIELNTEYSIFTINREIIYDNKVKGGKILFNLSNILHHERNYKINSLSNIFPINNKKISLMQRFFFTLSILLLFKNYYNEKILNNDISLKFIKSIEGIILQKNEKAIKLIISLDEDYTTDELTTICQIIRSILYINKDLSFKYNSYKDINISHIIR